MNYRAILIATAQTLGLFVAGFVIPLLGQMLALFTPVPLILVYLRNGERAGFITLVASSLIMAVLGGWQAAAILFLSFGLMAIGTAEGMRRSLKPEQTSLLGGLLPIAVLAGIVVFYLVRVGKNPITEVEVYLREIITSSAKTYTTMGLTEMAAMVSSIPDNFIYYLSRLLPSITIATSVTQAACCFGIARAILLRKPGTEPLTAQPSLALWHAPDSWVWGLIAALALIVVPQETARLIGWNLAILFAVLYLVQGIAIVEHYLRKAGIRAFGRGLLLALILAMPSIVFVIALGIVDIWADFRKVRVPAAIP
ncbi:MAG: YybS family protein [Nitrospirae bacterium]|nr:YybS family protein [Nitrospirota bacterium]